MTPTIESLRSEIEAVDARLVATIADRVRLAKAIGCAKAQSGQPVIDPAREAAVVTRASVLARQNGLPEDEIRALYWRLLALARRAQTGEGRREKGDDVRETGDERIQTGDERIKTGDLRIQTGDERIQTGD